jgi:heme-degrading monooxygenase HmoA
MPKIVDLDPPTPFISQIHADTDSIVLVNTFFVPKEKATEFLVCWKDGSEYMKSCPGFISAQLHRGTAGSQLFVNIATWESAAALARAHTDPEFSLRSSRHPDGIVIYPHIYQKVAVEGICVA